jgi:hypothetical protein
VAQFAGPVSDLVVAVRMGVARHEVRWS